MEGVFEWIVLVPRVADAGVDAVGGDFSNPREKASSAASQIRLFLCCC